MNIIARTRSSLLPAFARVRMMSGNLPGDQGSSGAIREAGGAFGKREAAQEEEYFYRKQREQLEDIKSHLDKEILFHQEQIKRHEDAIRRHKEQISSIPEKK